MGLSLKIAAGPPQRSHSQVWVPQNPWPHFTLSDSRLLQPREQGSPVTPLGTGFPFRRLLRWRDSNPPPHGWRPHYITPWHGPRGKHRVQQFPYCYAWIVGVLTWSLISKFIGAGYFLATAVVSLFLLWSLLSNGSVRRNIIQYVICICIAQWWNRFCLNINLIFLLS
jgi:hypothetical protein